MKQVNLVLALVVGGVTGFFVSRATSTPPPAAPTQAQAQRPAPPRPVEDARAVYRVPVDDSPVKGPADALVTIVEASDFQCPFCKRVAPTLKQIEEAYRGKVRFVFKHNPLPFHADALPAALASEEARVEGGDAKFWAMHDRLFESPSLDAASLEAAARAVGVDVAKVKEAVASKRWESRVRRDQALVTGLGASGTPSFFINGRKLVGAQPFEQFKTVIDDELAKAEGLVKAGTPPAELYAKIMAGAATAPVFVPGTPGAPAAGAPSAGPGAPSAPPAPPPQVYRKVELRPDDPVRGPASAKVTVVVFSDFQCPFCGRVEPTLKRLSDEYGQDLRVVWKHQPLAMHPNAMPAAIASEAARDQGKFWPMHDKLFERQQQLSEATYQQAAGEIGLDLGRFKAAIESRKGAARIAEDQKLAGELGVTGTPTLFFNCRQLVGALPYETMKPVVEDELRKAGALLKGAVPDAGFYRKACDANVAAAPAPPAPVAEAAPGHPARIDLRPDDPALGAAKAPVTLVLFSDFQCPFCSRLEPTLKQVERDYGNKVRIVWKHQPLPFHQNAMPAALAAEAAREQGKFWPMHDKLFENQQQLSDATYERIARDVGLDVGRWKAAYASGKYRSRVEEDARLAASLGVNGTPTMFVNGDQVVGAVPFETLKAKIDQKLAR